LRFGTWKVRGPDRSGSLTAAVRELARYKLDLCVYRKLGGTMGIGNSGRLKLSLRKEQRQSSIWNLIVCTP